MRSPQERQCRGLVLTVDRAEALGETARYAIPDSRIARTWCSSFFRAGYGGQQIGLWVGTRGLLCSIAGSVGGGCTLLAAREVWGKLPAGHLRLRRRRAGVTLRPVAGAAAVAT